MDTNRLHYLAAIPVLFGLLYAAVVIDFVPAGHPAVSALLMLIVMVGWCIAFNAIWERTR